MFDLSKMQIYNMNVSDLDEIKENLAENFDNFWSYEIFKEEYLRNFSDENGVELTYHPVYYICALQHS